MGYSQDHEAVSEADQLQLAHTVRRALDQRLGDVACTAAAGTRGCDQVLFAVVRVRDQTNTDMQVHIQMEVHATSYGNQRGGQGRLSRLPSPGNNT